MSVISRNISPSAAATLNKSASEAFLLLGASNDPHVVFEFGNSQKPVRVEENRGFVPLIVVRKFGNIGEKY